MRILDDQRDRLKHIFFTLLRVAGRERSLFRRVERERPLIVLNPHQVHPDPNPFWSPLHPRLFEELLRFVAKHFFVTTFAGHASNDSGRPSLILSFDDGYHDYVEYALPLLHAYRLPSNQNVIGESLVTGRPPAIVRVCDFLNQAPRSLVDELALPGFRDRLRSDGDRDKTLYGVALCNFLKARPRAEAAPLWHAMDAHMARFDGLVESRMMTVAEVRDASREHEIGAHSYSHESMEFESDAFFAEDFDRVATVFREQLALPLNVYAFPNGSHRASQAEWLHAHGVEHVLLVGDGYAKANAGTYQRFNFHATSRGEARFRALGYPARRSLAR